VIRIVAKPVVLTEKLSSIIGAMLLNFSQGMEESITLTCIHSACIRVYCSDDACKHVFLTHATRIYLVAGLYCIWEVTIWKSLYWKSLYEK